MKALRPLIKESALEEPRIRHGKFIPHTEDHRNLMKNLDLVRRSQPIFKANTPGEHPVPKKSIDIETGNQPLLKSINEYMKQVAQERPEPMQSSIVVAEMVGMGDSQGPKNSHTGGSYEDFKEIEKTLRKSTQADNIQSILSSQNEMISSQKGGRKESVTVRESRAEAAGGAGESEAQVGGAAPEAGASGAPRLQVQRAGPGEQVLHG